MTEATDCKKQRDGRKGVLDPSPLAIKARPTLFYTKPAGKI